MYLKADFGPFENIFSCSQKIWSRGVNVKANYLSLDQKRIHVFGKQMCLKKWDLTKTRLQLVSLPDSK